MRPDEETVKWTIRHPVERHCRHVSQAASGGSYVAIFDIRVEPYASPEPISFVNEAEPEPDVQQWVPSIIAGITQFVEEQAKSGIAVCGIKVTLTHLRDHPVDGKHKAFKKFAATAMAEIFEEAGTPA